MIKNLIRKSRKRVRRPNFAFHERSIKPNSIPDYSIRKGKFYQIPFTYTFLVFSFEHSDVAAWCCWFQCVAKGIIKSRILPWLSLWYVHLPAAARWWAAKTVQPWEVLRVMRRAHIFLGASLGSSMEPLVMGEGLGVMPTRRALEPCSLALRCLSHALWVRPNSLCLTPHQWTVDKH